MSYSHHHHDSSGKNLRTAFFLNLIFTIVEIIGGMYVNSVAIISDAVHDLGDSLSLGTAWYLDKKSKQSADDSFSFGYARFSLLGALINSVVLIAGSIFVINEAIQCIITPEQSDAQGMMYFAIAGIAVNGYAAWKMSGGKSLNERVVSWHLLEDVLGWFMVLVVSIILQFKDIPILDPVLSLAITSYILWGVAKRLKETLYLFLQGVPYNVNLPEVKRELAGVHHVASLHHVHIWSLEGEHHVFTAHVKLKNITSFEQIAEVKKQLKEIVKKYDFEHFTLETELEEESCTLGD